MARFGRLGPLVRRPFCILGGIGLLAFAAIVLLPIGTESPVWVGFLLVFHVFGFGFHLSANLLAAYLPHLPQWLDVLLVVLLGFLPYAAVDALLRDLRRRRGVVPA